MPTEPLLIISVILSAVAVVLCVVVFYRSGRSASVLSPILDQRVLGIEGTIGAALRDEFGRDRDETREASRSLREEVTGLFERLAGSLRASLTDLSTVSRLSWKPSRFVSAKPTPGRRRMLVTYERRSN